MKKLESSEVEEGKKKDRKLRQFNVQCVLIELNCLLQGNLFWLFSVCV